MTTNQKITVTRNMLRRSEDAPTILNDHESQLPGQIFVEFEETWQRDYGDEDQKTKRLLKREATGRRFAYIDRISSERYDDDAEVKAETDTLHVVIDPVDFTLLRLSFVD